VCFFLGSINTTTVVSKQTIAQEKQIDMSAQSEVITREKAEAKIALADAIPALEAAIEALNSLKKDDITEIRSFAKPNIYVQKVNQFMNFPPEMTPIEYQQQVHARV
jgi:dynein heavy chain